ncbi:MAG: phospholipase D-like domain-containing protein, partial [bacterium]
MRFRVLLSALPAVLAVLSAATVRAAGFHVPGYELVYSYPVETTLSEPDLRRALDVWPEMFNRAKKTIDIEEFYITPSTDPGEALEASLRALERAAKRGVRIRVLLEKKFEKNSLDGIARLKSIPGLDLRIIDWAGINGDGIVHAKFFIVDSTRAFVGSQNFDWRALKHIHELGLAIADGPVVRQVQSVFDHDWSVAAATTPAAPVQTERPAPDRARRAYLVASPWRLNPPGVGDSESELVRLLEEATGQVQIQLLDYSPLTRGKSRRFYSVLDNALRDASVRGVKVKLL